jgi:O-antigen/teichoic acid export membrane protein
LTWGDPTSIRSRFAASLAANMLRSLLNFLTGLVIARAMGPERYGDLVFLIGSFEAIRQAVAMGTDNAFFTFISRRERGTSFTLAYIGWQLLQLLATLAAVGLLLPAQWFEVLWLGHDRDIVVLACIAVFFQSQAWQTASHIGEARRLTIRVRAIGTAVAAAHLAIVAAAAWLGVLAIPIVLGLLIVEYGAALLAARILLRSNEAAPAAALPWTLKAWMREYAVYCAPLFFYGAGSFLYEFSNKWLLQRFGGAEQQGLFAVASQFSAACLLATTSMARILWKEAAELHHNGAHAALWELYGSASRMLYGFSAAMGGLLWPWSAAIAGLTLGQAYVDVRLPLAILFLYPAHQSLGQVTQTLFLATGNTLSYFWIGISFMIVSIPVTYLVLAPASAAVPGLGLGADGMALKTVLLNILFVNVYIWAISRRQAQRMAAGYQFPVLAWSAAAGGAAYWLAVRSPLAERLPAVLQIAMCVMLYGMLQLAFVARFPALFGMQADVVTRVRARAANAWRSIR